MVGQRDEVMRANCAALSNAVCGSVSSAAAASASRLELRPQLRRLVGGELLVGDQARAGEIDLLRRDQAHFVDQPRQHPHGIGAAGKAEQIDLVAGLIGVHQEGIGREHVVIEPIAGGEPQDGVEILLQLVPRVRPRQRADPRIVKHQLPRLRLLRLAQAAIELQHIGDVLGNLVAGAVAADDDVAHGDSRGESGDATLASIADFLGF